MRSHQYQPLFPLGLSTATGCSPAQESFSEWPCFPLCQHPTCAHHRCHQEEGICSQVSGQAAKDSQCSDRGPHDGNHPTAGPPLLLSGSLKAWKGILWSGQEYMWSSTLRAGTHLAIIQQIPTGPYSVPGRMLRLEIPMEPIV